MKKLISLLLISIALSGCATTFPSPQVARYQSDGGLTGPELFTQTFLAHGGEKLDQLKNVNVGLEGQWKQLIRRIQPLVTDFTYRVKSQERLLPKERAYISHYEGPAGTKAVFRSPEQISVWYNGAQSNDPAVLSSTALTGDSFLLFLLGPLALEKWQTNFQRITDAKLNGVVHTRLYLERMPGFGFSDRDEVVLWIDPTTNLTKMIQITLEGHDTTKGAHVEVEYLAYTKIEGYVFPSEFFERVNAPIAIDAHSWYLTGLDINRDYDLEDINGVELSGS